MKKALIRSEEKISSLLDLQMRIRETMTMTEKDMCVSLAICFASS